MIISHEVMKTREFYRPAVRFLIHKPTRYIIKLKKENKRWSSYRNCGSSMIASRLLRNLIIL